MRARSVVEIRVEPVDELDSELQLTADDGATLSFRSLQSRHATIEHAAERLAEHYGLEPRGPRRWAVPEAGGRKGGPGRMDGRLGPGLLAAGT